MERIVLEEVGIEAAAAKAAAALRSGGVVLYPTDTLYGLGADAFSSSTVDKIYMIKGRRDDKPIHAIVSDIDMAARCGVVDDTTRALVTKLPQGKVTFIVPASAGVSSGIMRGIDTFGFRIPDSSFCVAFCEAFGGPITATSANASGSEPARSVEAILAQLGERADIIDLVIDAGELPPSLPSTVVDRTSERSVVLREGVVLTTEIERCARV